MQRQFAESWNKLNQCLTKPLTELAELNMNTLQNWSKNTGHLDELMQIKKPEDLFTTQMKIAAIAQLEATSYLKKASDICTKAIEEMCETYSDVARETTVKTSEAMRTSQKSKE